MITFFYGKSGSGKSEWVTEEIGAHLLAGENVILLCPEQEAVIAEARITARFGGRIPTENLEILNFGRLPERVFREVGGLTVRELGAGGRRLIMHRTLGEAAPVLREYGSAASEDSGDGALLDSLLSAVAECKMNCITPSALETAAETLSHGAYKTLGDKVSDLSLIYALYEQYLHREYRDPEDMLSFLDEKLEETDSAFFVHKNIYLDGFNGFTAQQYRIIRRMFAHADAVTVSLGCEVGGERPWMMRRIYDTERTLFSILRDQNQEAAIRSLSVNRRTASPALRYLCDRLWHMGAQTQAQAIPLVGEDIRVFACDTPFSEAEAVALDIRRYVMAGGRYRDVTIITRDIERYEGILDAVFEKYELPLYMAHRSALSATPLFRYLRHLQAIVVWGAQRADVIGLLKTGFSGIEENDIFLFETYTEAWNLSGRAFLDGEDWNMNPAGYKEEVTEDDLAVLARVNLVKRTLAEGLFVFAEEMRTAEKTVAMHAAQLFSWLWEANIPALLDARAEMERASGDPADAEKTEQLWAMFVGALDTLVTVSGEVVCDANTFFSLFSLSVSDLDVASIPARCDEVTAGDAALLRPDRAKRVYLIGCMDGCFPKTPAEGTLLSDFDKSILEGLGITLSVGAADAMQDEMFHFWYACVAAEQALIVTYPTADLQGKAYRPSSGVERILALFPALTPENPIQAPLIDRAVNRATLFECYAAERAVDKQENGALAKVLSHTFASLAWEDEDIRRRLDALTMPLSRRRHQLNAETLALLFGAEDGRRTISMTQSRLESYVLCRFAYFCGYVLKLKEQKRVTFGTADIGSFVHYVLQKFMEQYAADENPARYEEEAVLDACIGELLSGYMEGVAGLRDGDNQPNRVRHLFARLRKTAVLIARNLIREFAQSDFRPRDFELTIGADTGREGEEHAIPPLSIVSDDGMNIRLYGKIDRVDTYEADGVTYLRVVDYKTYVKKFSLDDVRAGLNMQMLLYLFSVWQNGTARYGDTLRPAGILYMAANTAEVTHREIPSSEKAKNDAEKGLDRSGLFLEDEHILRAMDHDMAGAFIPVRLKKDGTFYKGAPLETLEGFGSLMNEVRETVCAITKEMVGGRADADPISRTHPDTGRDPCAYCAMRAVCRI